MAIVNTADNSQHFFPDTPAETETPVTSIWPVKGKRFITKVDNFYDVASLPKVVSDIQHMHSVPNSKRYTNIVRVPLIGGFRIFPTYFLYAPIAHFGNHCTINNKDTFEKELRENQASDVVANFTLSSIEKMATLGGWANIEVPVAAFCIRYRLTSETSTLSGFPWHRDVNSFSMTSVITPNDQGDGSFSGGELSFAERTQDYAAYECCDGGENTVLSHTIKTITYPYGGCLFFENLWSQHKVNDMKITSGHQCERVLFSIFANPNPDQLASFTTRNEAKNLATISPPGESRCSIL